MAMTLANDQFEDLEVLEEDEGSVTDEPEVEAEPGAGGRRIFTDKLDPKIFGLYQDWKQGDLILDPKFQRRKVWDEGRASRLIESVLLEVPLPVFYFAENADATQEVIDGQQRLNAFFSFLDNAYSLTGLRELGGLNGRYFRDLDAIYQKQVRNSPIRTVVFKKESDEALRFQIFERLNTGAMPLNAQELRNCVYRGAYNDLLHELSRDRDYMGMMGFKGPEKRMKDVEYVLRFCAFHNASYLNYKPSMERFLNEEMKKHQNLTPEEAEQLRITFKNAVALVRSLLGKNAFKRYYRGDSKSPSGRWEPKKFNASLYDILMWSMAREDKNQVMARLDTIREAFIMLMTQDQEFIDSIELSTSSIKAVTIRFDKWRLALKTILAANPRQPRCFSRTLKESLHRSDPTCKICNQHIIDLDDAAVDHVKMYWLGGESIPDNARLTHRYCNWARSKAEGAPGPAVSRED
jgi:hypothetical protein